MKWASALPGSKIPNDAWNPQQSWQPKNHQAAPGGVSVGEDSRTVSLQAERTAHARVGLYKCEA